MSGRPINRTLRVSDVMRDPRNATFRHPLNVNAPVAI